MDEQRKTFMVDRRGELVFHFFAAWLDAFSHARASSPTHHSCTYFFDGCKHLWNYELDDESRHWDGNNKDLKVLYATCTTSMCMWSEIQGLLVLKSSCTLRIKTSNKQLKWSTELWALWKWFKWNIYIWHAYIQYNHIGYEQYVLLSWGIVTWLSPLLSPQAASLPMSIIIVGVGPAEFDGKCGQVRADGHISDMFSKCSHLCCCVVEII